MEDQYNYNQVDPAIIDPDADIEPVIDPDYREDYQLKQPISNTKPVAKLKVKKPLIIGAIALITLTIIGVLYYLLGPASAPQVTKAELTYVEGDVLLLGSDGKWSATKTGIDLPQGTTLKVGNQGRATISLDDGSAIRLNYSTTVILTSLDSKHIVVTNDGGEIYTRVAKSTRVFDVLVDGNTYRAAGTAYKTILFREITTAATDTTATTKTKGKTTINGVEVYESKVQIINSNSANEALVNQGEKYFLANIEAPTLIKKSSPLASEDVQKDEFVMWNKDLDSNIAAYHDQMGVLGEANNVALNITNPTDQETTTSVTIIVAGTVDKTAKLSINDVAVKNNNGTFSYELTLVPGANAIKVIAEDLQGKKTVKTITVKLTSDVSPTAGVSGTPVTSNQLVLSAVAVTDGINFTWTVSDLTITNGFKLIKSAEHANPTYPSSDDFQTITGNSTRSYSWSIKDGKVYHFRICQYDGNGSCQIYSKDITLTAPTLAPTATPTSLPTNTPTNTPVVTPTSTPTATPIPTATPTPTVSPT